MTEGRVYVLRQLMCDRTALGKTVLGLEMSKLFGWAHTQSDDFHMKKSGPHFIRSVKDLLQTHEVVYADK